MSDERDGLSLETDAPPEVATLEDGEPEPEGVVEVKPGEKVVPIAVLTAERRRVKEATEKKIRDSEIEPLREKASLADRLQADLTAIRPDLEFLRDHPEIRRREPPKPAAPDVSDAEVETYARRHQLYDKTGELDKTAARSILSEHKTEVARISTETARAAVAEAVGPVHEQTNARASQDQFTRMAALRDGDGEYVFKNPRAGQILIEEWRKLPVHLTANPDVADVVVNNALGRIARELPRRRPGQEPVFSESAGGRTPQAFALSDLERKVAGEARISTKDFETRAKKYQPGQPNSLED